MARSYDNTQRAARAADTRDRIVDATEALLASGPFAEVTLQRVASEAGVTVQTVLRHLGSREGCLQAVAARVQARIERQRGGVGPEAPAVAVARLVDHYEQEGRLVLRLLAEEAAGDPFSQAAAAAGRAYHRAWCARCFGASEADATRLDALVAATDLSTWKLLRLDLGRSREQTEAVITRLVRSLEAP